MDIKGYKVAKRQKCPIPEKDIEVSPLGILQ